MLFTKNALNSLCLEAEKDNAGGTDDATQDNQNNNTEGKETETLTMEMVQKEIQRAQDKIRTEYTKKVKSLEAEKEELLKEKMSEEEKKKFEFDKYEKALREKETTILQRELNLKAVDLLTENELDLEFRPLVIGSNEETTVANIETLKKLWHNAINKAVETRFKENGRNVDTKPDNKNIDTDGMSMGAYAEEWKKKNRKYQ